MQHVFEDILALPRWSSQAKRTLVEIMANAGDWSWEQQIALVEAEARRIDQLSAAASRPVYLEESRAVQAVVQYALQQYSAACALLYAALLGDCEAAVEDVLQLLQEGDDAMLGAQEQIDLLRGDLARVA